MELLGNVLIRSNKQRLLADPNGANYAVGNYFTLNFNDFASTMVRERKRERKRKKERKKE